MAATIPTMMKYKSKWVVNDFIFFHVGYKAEVNKGGGYSKSFTKDIKPSIIQQHQAFVEFFLNNSDPVIKGVTGGEEKKALDAFNYTVHVVKF